MSVAFIKVYDADLTFVGVLPAQVQWTEKLSGANDLEKVTIPRSYLKADGTTESRIAYLDDGWYVDWNGKRYIVDSLDSDLETDITFQGIDAATELANFYSNYSPGPGTWLNRLPSDIATNLLAGLVGRSVKNPGFGILDNAGLPTNWSHPTGWASALVSNRRVWQAAAGTSESYSDDRPCTVGVSYRFRLDALAANAEAGTVGVLIRWIKADGSTVDSAAVNLSTKDGAFHEIASGDIVALGARMRIVLSVTGTGATAQFDDVRLYEIGPDTGYTYAGSMDTRSGAIPLGDGALVKYGVWAEGGGPPATYLESTAPGDYIARVISGPFVTVNWKGGGAGATSTVRVNGVHYQQSGADLIPGTTPIDVSADLSLTCSGLDPTNDHIVEVEVAAVKTRFGSFTVSTDNLISMRWDYVPVWEALASLRKAVGGELSFDAITKVVTHAPTIGQDLKANNVVQFRRGANLVSIEENEGRSKIVNRVIGLGYGEGEYQLVVTADATGVVDGVTSIEKYGVRRGTYTNKECKSLATMTAECQAAVEISSRPIRSYTVRCTDAAAALCAPGDTGHFVYQDRNLSLRILEIRRSTESAEATLIVSNRADDIYDVIASAAKQLATLNKSYQGVPTDGNVSFSEAFERTSGGSDYPAEVLFFVPYGADLLDLRLRYQAGGMRAYAKSAMDGGGDTYAASAGGADVITSDASSIVTTSAMMIRIHKTPDLTDIITFSMVAAGAHNEVDTTNVLTYTPTDRATCYAFLNLFEVAYGAHIPSTTYHQAADTTNTPPAADNTSIETLCGSGNAAKQGYNAHQTQAGVHYASGSDTVTATASDEASLVTLCLDLKAKYALHLTRSNAALFTAINDAKAKLNTHMPSTTYHETADTQTISSPDADTIASGITLISEIITKFNLHIVKIACHRISDVSNAVAATATDAATLFTATGELVTGANNHFLGVSGGSNSGVRVATARQVQVAEIARSIECAALTGGSDITFIGCIQNNGSGQATFPWTLYGTFPGDAEGVIDTGSETIAAGASANVEVAVSEGYAVRFEVTQTGTTWDTDALIDAQPGLPAVTGPAEGGGGGGLMVGVIDAVNEDFTVNIEYGQTIYENVPFLRSYYPSVGDAVVFEAVVTEGSGA